MAEEEDDHAHVRHLLGDLDLDQVAERLLARLPAQLEGAEEEEEEIAALLHELHLAQQQRAQEEEETHVPAPPPVSRPPATSVDFVSDLDRTVHLVVCQDDSQEKEEEEEGQHFELSLRAALHSRLIRSMLGDTLLGEEETNQLQLLQVPILNVARSVLARVCQFLTRHEFEPYVVKPKPLPIADRFDVPMRHVCDLAWDADFADELQRDGLVVDVLLASNFLDIPSLLDLCIVKLAVDLHNCRGSEPELNAYLQLDAAALPLTPDERHRVKTSCAWLFGLPAAAAEEGEEGGLRPAAKQL